MQTHSGKPTIVLQAPPGKEGDTTEAALVYASISAGAAAAPVDEPGDEVVPVNPYLRQPADPRLTPTPMPTVPVLRQGESLPPSVKSSRRGQSTKGGGQSSPSLQPPTNKATPQALQPSPKTGSITQLTLTQLTHKDNK